MDFILPFYEEKQRISSVTDGAKCLDYANAKLQKTNRASENSARAFRPVLH